jgi:hypothetical protein
MKFYLEKYFEISTIHGFFYISKKFHIVERQVLGLMFGTCMQVGVLA